MPQGLEPKNSESKTDLGSAFAHLDTLSLRTAVVIQVLTLGHGLRGRLGLGSVDGQVLVVVGGAGLASGLDGLKIDLDGGSGLSGPGVHSAGLGLVLCRGRVLGSLVAARFDGLRDGRCVLLGRVCRL